AGAAAAAGSAALAPTDGGAEAEKHPAPAPADEADGTDPADGTGTGGDAEPAAQEAAAQHTSTEARPWSTICSSTGSAPPARSPATSTAPGRRPRARPRRPGMRREPGPHPSPPGGSPRVAQPLPALLLPVLPARPEEPIPARSPLRTRTSPRAPRARTGRSPVRPPPRLRWRPLPRSRPDR